MPYVWGGGHGSFESSGYDCSGAVSYALHGGGFLSTPLDSTGFSYWGEAGPGSWITVYANSGHAFVVIAGLRWDTSQTGGDGPSWSRRWSTRRRTAPGILARVRLLSQALHVTLSCKRVLVCPHNSDLPNPTASGPSERGNRRVPRRSGSPGRIGPSSP